MRACRLPAGIAGRRDTTGVSPCGARLVLHLKLAPRRPLAVEPHGTVLASSLLERQPRGRGMFILILFTLAHFLLAAWALDLWALELSRALQCTTQSERRQLYAKLASYRKPRRSVHRHAGPPVPTHQPNQRRHGGERHAQPN